MDYMGFIIFKLKRKRKGVGSGREKVALTWSKRSVRALV